MQDARFPRHPLRHFALVFFSSSKRTCSSAADGWTTDMAHFRIVEQRHCVVSSMSSLVPFLDKTPRFSRNSWRRLSTPTHRVSRCPDSRTVGTCCSFVRLCAFSRSVHACCSWFCTESTVCSEKSAMHFSSLSSPHTQTHTHPSEMPVSACFVTTCRARFQQCGDGRQHLSPLPKTPRTGKTSYL